jgi:hypothetical protein
MQRTWIWDLETHEEFQCVTLEHLTCSLSSLICEMRPPHKTVKRVGNHHVLEIAWC